MCNNLGQSSNHENLYKKKLAQRQSHENRRWHGNWQDILLDGQHKVLNLRRGLVSSFFILGRVLRHFCNVLLQNNRNLKQNIAEMSQDEKARYKIGPLISSLHASPTEKQQGLKKGGLCELSKSYLIPSRQVRGRVYLSYLEVKQIGTIQQDRGQNLFKYSQLLL